jgi:hypothetical protein
VTEAEWLACTDPQPMLGFLQGKASDRKLRLFAVACCRRIWNKLTLKPVRQAVETAEHYADGAVTDEELNQAHRKGIVAFTGTLYRNVTKMAGNAAWAIKMRSMGLAVNTAHAPPFQIELFDELGKDEFLKAFCPALLRDIIGNPCRPVALDPAWRTATVTALAIAAYEERIMPAGTLDSQRLAILADALEDAGCTDEQILTHLRGPRPHVRGCWALDLLLGKE